MIDSNIQQQMRRHYNRLNEKLDHLLQKQPKYSLPPRHDDNCHFYTRVKKPNKYQTRRLNYSTERPTSTHAANLIAETEQAIRLLDVKLQNTYRFMAMNKLKQIVN
jgi:hypothetical protein